MAEHRTRSRHQRAGQRTLQRMPGVYFDEREMCINVTANATKAELSRLAELIGVKEKLDAERRVPEPLF
jgi:hypothetical protein